MGDTEPGSAWALQLVVQVEKAAPPRTVAACAAAALATIALLEDERARSGGAWHRAVATWNGMRIRKIVRRARGADWSRVALLDGVTVERDGARVRAFVPCPVDDAPTELRKLQIQSTPLDEVEPIGALPAMAPTTLAIAITPHFAMSWGKQAAQSAHAGQLAWQSAPAATRNFWNSAGRPLVVLHPNQPLWAALGELATTRIHDGGFTEIPPGTNSALAWWSGD